MYCHGSYISDTSTNPINPINKFNDCNLSEPVIGYARVLKHPAYLWRLTATHPGCTVNLYHDNVSRAFLQLNHHPDIDRGNFSLHGNMMIVSVDGSPFLWWKLWSGQLGPNSLCAVLSCPVGVQTYHLTRSTQGGALPPLCFTTCVSLYTLHYYYC